MAQVCSYATVSDATYSIPLQIHQGAVLVQYLNGTSVFRAFVAILSQLALACEDC